MAHPRCPHGSGASRPCLHQGDGQAGHQVRQEDTGAGTALYLLLGLEDVAPEDVAGSVPCYVAEDLQVLGVVRHVEDPAEKHRKPENSVGASVREEASARGALRADSSRHDTGRWRRTGSQSPAVPIRLLCCPDTVPPHGSRQPAEPETRWPWSRLEFSPQGADPFPKRNRQS